MLVEPVQEQEPRQELAQQQALPLEPGQRLERRLAQQQALPLEPGQRLERPLAQQRERQPELRQGLEQGLAAGVPLGKNYATGLVSRTPILVVKPGRFVMKAIVIKI